MSEPTLHEYLVLSRGQWDASLPPERIQAAIDDFYRWYEGLVAAGTMGPGHRLAREGKLVSRERVIDGPLHRGQGSRRRLLVHPRAQPRGSGDAGRTQPVHGLRPDSLAA